MKNPGGGNGSVDDRWRHCSRNVTFAAELRLQIDSALTATTSRMPKPHGSYNVKIEKKLN